MSLYSIAKLLYVTLVLPPGGLLLLCAAGLVWQRWNRRRGVAVASFALLALWSLSLPAVSSLLVGAMGATAVSLSDVASTQAIVIPGGGVRIDAAEFGGDALNVLSLERVRYGAQLVRKTGLPVLVTGGMQSGASRSEAELMRSALVEEFGLPVRWMEPTARNTRENALRSRALLQVAKIDRVTVIVHGFDAARARREFADAGFAVVVAPTGLAPAGRWQASDFLPNAAALQQSHWVTYEISALLFHYVGF